MPLSSTDSKTGVKHRAASFGIVLASVLLALLLFEFALRAIGFEYAVFYNFNEQTGIVLRPGVKGWWTDEGKAYIEINRHGFRDQDHSIEKPKDTVRIAVLGDSYVEALQVPIAATFWSLLEQELNNCRAFGEKRVEVTSFGVSGYGTAQELILFQQQVALYQPDIVLLAFLTGNDVSDNSNELAGNKLKPFFALAGNGELTKDVSFKESVEWRRQQSTLWQGLISASDHSRLVQLLYKARINMRRLAASGANQGNSESGLDNGVFVAPASGSAWDRAWRVTERLIASLRGEVVSRGASFLLVTLTNGVQVHPDLDERARYARSLGVSDLLYPDTRLEKFARKEGIPLIALVRPFREYAVKHKVFLHGFEGPGMGRGHWNQLGHELASKAIAKQLCRAPQT